MREPGDGAASVSVVHKLRAAHTAWATVAAPDWDTPLPPLRAARTGGEHRMHNLKSAAKVRRQQAFDQPLTLIAHRPPTVGPHNIGGLGRIRALTEKETDR